MRKKTKNDLKNDLNFREIVSFAKGSKRDTISALEEVLTEAKRALRVLKSKKSAIEDALQCTHIMQASMEDVHAGIGSLWRLSILIENLEGYEANRILAEDRENDS